MSTIKDEVKQVVHRHLTGCSTPIPGLGSWCDLYAERIIYADIDDTHAFGASRDANNIKELHKTIKRATFLISELESTTIRHFNSHLGLISEGDFEGYSPLMDLLFELSKADTALTSVRESSSYSSLPSSKPNWRAIGVAKCCRVIWAEHARRSNPEKYGTEPINQLLTLSFTEDDRDNWSERREEYNRFIETHAPTSQNHNRPGEFGRFLEDIFQTLGILGKDGGPVKAATALDALKKIECQENNRKN